MDETLCSECNKPLPSPPYQYKYCPVCRTLYGIDERTDLAGRNSFSQKGRDLLAERLRDGFQMLDEDDV